MFLPESSVGATISLTLHCFLIVTRVWKYIFNFFPTFFPTFVCFHLENGVGMPLILNMLRAATYISILIAFQI